MVIKVVNSTDGHFKGQSFIGSTLEEAIMPLVEHAGLFNIKITETKVILSNSNYLIVARITKYNQANEVI